MDPVSVKPGPAGWTRLEVKTQDTLVSRDVALLAISVGTVIVVASRYHVEFGKFNGAFWV
jgi:hypothetical protein